MKDRYLFKAKQKKLAKTSKRTMVDNWLLCLGI